MEKHLCLNIGTRQWQHGYNTTHSYLTLKLLTERNSMDEDNVIGEVDIDIDILEWLLYYDEENHEYDDQSDYGIEL